MPEGVGAQQYEVCEGTVSPYNDSFNDSAWHSQINDSQPYKKTPKDSSIFQERFCVISWVTFKEIKPKDTHKYRACPANTGVIRVDLSDGS